jgi:hypothetical protein
MHAVVDNKFSTVANQDLVSSSPDRRLLDKTIGGKQTESYTTGKKKKGVVKGVTIMKGSKPAISFSTNSFYKIYGTPVEQIKIMKSPKDPYG